MTTQTTAKRINGTYFLAMSAAADVANARMRKAGRTAWTVGDYNEAVRAFNRIHPATREKCLLGVTA